MPQNSRLTFAFQIWRQQLTIWSMNESAYFTVSICQPTTKGYLTGPILKYVSACYKLVDPMKVSEIVAWFIFTMVILVNVNIPDIFGYRWGQGKQLDSVYNMHNEIGCVK